MQCRVWCQLEEWITKLKLSQWLDDKFSIWILKKQKIKGTYEYKIQRNSTQKK